jgi:hypothetical protein
MTISQRRVLGAVWFLAAAAAGCGSGPTEPATITGRYVLTTLNETALPYDHEGLGCCTYLSGELLLEAGDYTASITARNRNTGLVFVASEWGAWSARGLVLSFTPQGFAAAPLGLDAGAAGDGEIRLTFGGEGPGSPDQFRAKFALP